MALNGHITFSDLHHWNNVFSIRSHELESPPAEMRGV
jgi:hypothetical protein